MIKKLKTARVFVSGAIAYDRIMNFDGLFKDHILPNKIHVLNLSFPVDTMRESYGGTAANVAYNLSLHGIPNTIIATAGNDFGAYRKWLIRNRVDVSKVTVIKSERTITFYIITDKNDNQINVFYRGTLAHSTGVNLKRVVKQYPEHQKYLHIISGTYIKDLRRFVAEAASLGMTIIFDPGQQLLQFNKTDLRYVLQRTNIFISNDYEYSQMMDTAKLTKRELMTHIDLLVTTLGPKGSRIQTKSKTYVIPPAQPKNTSDPTGAGDAYRAGFLRGLIEGWPLEKVGRVAGLTSVYTVEKYGTQTHRFTQQEFARRYYQNFKEKL